ncbi:hypothetical protein NPX13_g11329 [Xylaria arbuscula]|uniref:Uncharacterized protein n=1 Tax=Xylaria arbuscula TaxID=114810 RepID=A0A9W8TH18_9PEZI|nr:hypothetical protein NPX13_g11329 [Xylaria arbuscula]
MQAHANTSSAIGLRRQPSATINGHSSPRGYERHAAPVPAPVPVIAMGNLKDKIKATLLRRDSWRLSPSPSKNSFGRDYASSASTHTQPGYDASDERSDHRSLSLSLSHARALRRSTSGSRSKSSLNDQSSHAHTPHANTSAAPTEKTRQKPRPSQNPARTRDEVHHADSAEDGGGGGDSDEPTRSSKAPTPAPVWVPVQQQRQLPLKQAPNPLHHRFKPTLIE